MRLNRGGLRPIHGNAGGATGVLPHVLDWLDHLVQQRPMLLFVLCLLLCLVVGLLAGAVAARRRAGRGAATSRSLGKRGHARALELLREYGFEVLELEVTAPGMVQVDSRLEEYIVRADALVRRKGRTYVAEFKGGADASSIQNRATRRQLLEYSCVFGTDGILLVDAHAGRIHYVRFVSAAQPDTYARDRLPV
ncbi:MAG: hypothetical protein O2894_08060 [Planctomycetota bacterium]|nr:hypothetical protein [Planctomycetota bacterium]